MDGFYVARPDGTVIGKFTEKEFRDKVSRGEIWRDCLYLPPRERQWQKVFRYPGAEFPPPVNIVATVKANAGPKISLRGAIYGFIATAVILVLVGYCNKPAARPAVSIAEREAIAAQADAEEDEKDATAARGVVRTGMNRQQSRVAWGEPSWVGSERNAGGILEVWSYQTGLHQGYYLYFQNGVLRKVQKGY